MEIPEKNFRSDLVALLTQFLSPIYRVIHPSFFERPIQCSVPAEGSSPRHTRTSFFYIPFFRNLLLAASAVVIAVPVYLLVVVHPSFEQALIQNTEREAVRITAYLSEIAVENASLHRESFAQTETASNLGFISETLGLFKLRVFSSTGEIVFSTVQKEIGRVNEHDYFLQRVARGEVLSKLVSKGNPSAEGERIDLHVVESYVPIMLDGVFLGAVEVYYDITAIKHDQEQRLLETGAVMSLLGTGLIVFMFVVSRRAFRSYCEYEGAEDALRESEARYRTLLETTAEGFWLIDNERKTVEVNESLCKMLGYTRQDMIGKKPFDFVDDENRKIFIEQTSKIPSTRHRIYEIALLKKNGENLHTIFNATTLRNRSGEVQGGFAFVTDISERKQAEERLRLSAKVFTHSHEGIVITDADENILDANDAFTTITGYSRAEVIGQTPRMLKSGQHDREFYACLWHDLLEKDHWNGEIWNRRKDGEIYAELLTISTVRDAHGNPQNYVALFSDITAKKEYQRRLEHIAHHDALTGLPNRMLLADRLNQAIAHAQRRQQFIAVMYLDLDGFKAINDNHGHQMGDTLLVAVANRMKWALRAGDTVARLGGDEFSGVLNDLENVQAAIPIISRMLAAVACPVHAGDLVLQVSASVGMTYYPQAEETIDAEQLLCQADHAMYRAKQAGKNRYHIFEVDDCFHKNLPN